MRYNMNPLRWNAHPNMKRFLGLANGNPSFDLPKNLEAPNARESQSREAAGNPAVSPTFCLNRRKKVAIDTPHTGLTVIQKHPIDTTQAVIVQVLDQRDF